MADLENLSADNLTLKEIKRIQKVLAIAQKNKIDKVRKL